MKIQKIDDRTSFQAIKFDPSVSQDLAKSLKQSAALKRFKMFYSAEISQTGMLSSRKKDVSYSCLVFDNIRPRSFAVRLFDFITGRSAKRCDGFYFNPKTQTDEALIKCIGKLKKDTFLKLTKSK